MIFYLVITLCIVKKSYRKCKESQIFKKMQAKYIFARFKFDQKQIRNQWIEIFRKLTVVLYKATVAQMLVSELKRLWPAKK